MVLVITLSEVCANKYKLKKRIKNVTFLDSY